MIAKKKTTREKIAQYFILTKITMKKTKDGN